MLYQTRVIRFLAPILSARTIEYKPYIMYCIYSSRTGFSVQKYEHFIRMWLLMNERLRIRSRITKSAGGWQDTNLIPYEVCTLRVDGVISTITVVFAPVKGQSTAGGIVVLGGTGAVIAGVGIYAV